MTLSDRIARGPKPADDRRPAAPSFQVADVPAIADRLALGPEWRRRAAQAKAVALVEDVLRQRSADPDGGQRLEVTALDIVKALRELER